MRRRRTGKCNFMKRIYGFFMQTCNRIWNACVGLCLLTGLGWPSSWFAYKNALHCLTRTTWSTLKYFPIGRKIDFLSAQLWCPSRPIIVRWHGITWRWIEIGFIYFFIILPLLPCGSLSECMNCGDLGKSKASLNSWSSIFCLSNECQFLFCVKPVMRWMFLTGFNWKDTTTLVAFIIITILYANVDEIDRQALSSSETTNWPRCGSFDTFYLVTRECVTWF